MANSFYTETFTAVAGTPTSKSQMDVEFDAIAAGLVLAQAPMNLAIKAPPNETLSAEIDVTSTRQGKFMAFDSNGDYSLARTWPLFTAPALVRHCLVAWNTGVVLHEGGGGAQQYAAFTNTQQFGSSLFVDTDPGGFGGGHYQVLANGLFLVMYHAEVIGTPSGNDDPGAIIVVNHSSAFSPARYTEIRRTADWNGANLNNLANTRRISLAGLMNIQAGSFVAVAIFPTFEATVDWNFKNQSLMIFKVGELL